MTTRRAFLGAVVATGAGFCGCGLCGPALAQAPQAKPPDAPKRREVAVGGRRVTTVDVHAHVAFADALALMGLKLEQPSLAAEADHLSAMDARGIDVAALSINGYWYSAERALAEKLIALQNEKLAALCAAKPDRFVAFASVALQHPDMAAQQLEHAVKTLGLRGAAIGGAVEGVPLSDPKFDPFWAKAEELGCLVFVHPESHGQYEQRMRTGAGPRPNYIGLPGETAVALSNLIFHGTLDRFPKLKVCGARGGVILPTPEAVTNRTSAPSLKRALPDYLRQLYYDSIVFTPQGLGQLAKRVGASQVLLGTDSPFAWTSAAVDYVIYAPGLSNDEQRAILGGTAARLLGIKP